MNNDLIYDLGMHNGNDTAYYLACGFRVVSVEADPVLAAAAREHFQAEIAQGKLTILNVGISEQAGTAEFWINETRSHFNSFDRESAARLGDPHHAIVIPCRRLDDILRELGMPYYLKIDIEGYDVICCDQLTPETRPQFISVEMSRIELLRKLNGLGYDRFKLVTQTDLQTVAPEKPAIHVSFLRATHRLANYHKDDRRFTLRVARTAAAQVLWAVSALGLEPWGTTVLKSPRLPGWKFVEGCSGAFGEDLPGEWLTSGQIEELWPREVAAYEKMGREFWCDLHATTLA